MRRRTRTRSGALRLVALFVVATAVPLVTLTISSVHLASDALIDDVMERVDQTADLAASVVQEDLRGLTGLVESVAGQADLVAALGNPDAHLQRIQEHLIALQSAHPGIDAVLLTDPSGRLVAMVPPNPSLVGSEVQYQSWYHEVTAIGRPSVSSAFLNPWPGNPVEVAVAALIHQPSRGAAPGKDLGTLVAVYDLGQINELVDEFSLAEAVDITVLDQRGNAVLGAEASRGSIISLGDDPAVGAALAGNATVVTDGPAIAAFVPVKRLGWVVTASVHKSDALASVGKFRSTVYAVAGMLAVILAAGLLLLARTLRARRRAESEASEANAFLESVVESLPTMLFIKEAEELRFVRFNRAGEELVGRSRNELLGKTDRDFFPEAEAEFFTAKDREVLESGRLLDIPEEEIETPDGLRILHTRKIPINDAEGRPRYLLGISEDITEQKRLEAAIRESEERYRLLVENAPDMVFTLSPDGTFTSLNRGFETLTGWRREEWIGKSYGSLIDPADLETAKVRVARMMLGERLAPFRTRMRTRSGEWRSVESVSSPQLQDGSTTAQIVGVIRDITERKAAEDAVRQAKEEAERAKDQADRANRAKSEFLSRMSHELRTPLNAVLGFGQLLEMDSLSDDQRESVGQILKGGRHLLDLINEVLDISRIEVGKISLSLEPVAVGEAVLGAVDLIRPLAAERGIDIATDVPDSIGHVTADRQRLKQILLNLLSNAVKYNREGGTVTVRAALAAEGRVRVNVADNGPGLEPESMSRLFVPFDRLGAETSGIEGTGLGLALSKRLVEVMGGSMSVDSEPGRGSTFSVSLQSVESPEARLRREAGNGLVLAAVNGEGTILHIEDNPANLTLIERILAGLRGVKLISAMQGSLGLDMARQHHPDVILLDLNLPDIQGQEVLSLLRSDPRTRDIPVLVVSADATPDQLRRLRAAGANAYLTKPLDVPRFLQIVGDALRERRMDHAG